MRPGFWCGAAGALAAMLVLTDGIRAETPPERSQASQCIARWAIPSDSCGYTGYYVGGGQAVGGTCRHALEGTWGWDYDGWLLPHRVLLYWSHGRRYQGGTGSYKTDGPHVPDLPGLLNPALYAKHRCQD